MKLLLSLLLVAGCQSGDPQGPGPMDPDEAVESDDDSDNGQDPDDADSVYVREFDACWKVYRECLASRTGTRAQRDEVCFPPHEKCVVTAYRKFKKAKGKG